MKGYRRSAKQLNAFRARICRDAPPKQGPQLTFEDSYQPASNFGPRQLNHLRVEFIGPMKMAARCPGQEQHLAVDFASSMGDLRRSHIPLFEACTADSPIWMP